MSTEITSSKYEKERYEAILAHYKVARKVIDHRKLPALWSRWEADYNNEYWDGSGRPGHLSRFTSNGFFEFIETTLPFVVGRPPQPENEAEPPAEMVADVTVDDPMLEQQIQEKKRAYLDALSDWVQKLKKEQMEVWTEDNMTEKLQVGYREHCIKGNLCAKINFDPGTREIETEICDISTIFPDPQQETLDGCEKTWFIHAFFLTPADIKREYGVDVDAEGYFDEEGTFRYWSLWNRAKEALHTVMGHESGGKKEGFTLVLEHYSPDSDGIEEEYDAYLTLENGQRELDEDGNPKIEKKLKPRFPSGHRIETVIRNYQDRLVAERDNILGRLPFIWTVNYRRQGDMWGQSDCKNVENHIHAKNLIVSNVIDNIRLFGNPQWKKRKSFKGKITNEGGKIYEISNPDDLTQIQPAGVMSPGLLQFLQYLDEDRDIILGVKDALRGVSEAGDSGIKTQSLIEQGQGRLQPKILQFIEFSRQWFEIVAFIIRNFYDEEIIQREEDEDGNAAYGLFNPGAFADVELNVRVNTMSMLPFDKYSEFEEGRLYFELGLMSPEQFIDLAPSLRDKQRAKEFVAKKQLEESRQAQFEQAAEQFVQLAQQAGQALDNPESAGNLDEIAMPVIEMVRQFPELMQLPEFQAFPENIRKAAAAAVAGLGQNQKQEA